MIFDAIWQDLVDDHGLEELRFPKEIILLGGAPGAGKGTNTAFIARTRGLTSEPVVMSALLDSPEMRKVKDAGGMIGDREAVAGLLVELLKPEHRRMLLVGADLEELLARMERFNAPDTDKWL